MQDQLYRGIIDSLDIRFVLADCPQTANDIILRHNCDPASAHVVSRAVGAAALLSTLLTEDEKYMVRWNYKGALTCVLADCDAAAHIRALINPTDLTAHVNKPEDIWGDGGTITVIKSSATQVLNSGSTTAELLDVVEDLAFHFSTSDQIETAMAVIPRFSSNPEQPVTALRGIMLQALPDCDLERFDRIRNRLSTQEVRDLLMRPVTQDNLFERIVMLLAKEEVDKPSFTLEHTVSPSFKCSCTKEAMKNALATMDRSEIEEILAKEGAVTMTCRFCNTTHKITKEDLDS
ncbi:MAG: Hsp33 family molecular chaperone HslO [Victivallales bacterium]|nr:Hsp33 family molecular chaperone HslO [Victivallales bacterium]